MKKISVVIPCYNEEENIEPLYQRTKAVTDRLDNYLFEFIFCDNASTDRTVDRVKALISHDPRVRLIINSRNFGQIRSAIHGYMQGSGDAVIAMVADLQDPPEMIEQFVRKWEEGYRVVVAVKPASLESPVMATVRRTYYRMISRIAEIDVIQNFSGFGLYDRVVIDYLRGLDDPYPFFRGIISEVGYDRYEIPFVQPARARGVTKNNFYSLYDYAMLGVTSVSKVPLRVATMLGFSLSLLSLLIAFGYLAAKIIFWNSFSLGMAPMVIGLFFFGAVQLFFIGILGEYIGAIHTQVLKRPLVVEKERINFHGHSER
jgi:polyisoprenyl-phosphate glycosyltransferase